MDIKSRLSEPMSFLRLFIVALALAAVTFTAAAPSRVSSDIQDRRDECDSHAGVTPFLAIVEQVEIRMTPMAGILESIPNEACTPKIITPVLQMITRSSENPHCHYQTTRHCQASRGSLSITRCH
ncbi:hypothetical protein WG66_004479 [Moniliophthora roreri]|nr:hypothetical protein WG66_004479 [Moniliophthora roreri]